VPSLPVRCSAIALPSNTRRNAHALVKVDDLPCPARIPADRCEPAPSASRYCRYSISKVATTGTSVRSGGVRLIAGGAAAGKEECGKRGEGRGTRGEG
jgi:hypothetical protein